MSSSPEDNAPVSLLAKSDCRTACTASCGFISSPCCSVVFFNSSKRLVSRFVLFSTADPDDCWYSSFARPCGSTNAEMYKRYFQIGALCSDGIDLRIAAMSMRTLSDLTIDSTTNLDASFS